jgi:hypothetical protein
MDQFSGIFFDMDSLYPDSFFGTLAEKFHFPVDTDGKVVLRNLVSFRKVGIEIVLTVEDHLGKNFTAESQGSLDG